jgi:hypothetical protein
MLYVGKMFLDVNEVHEVEAALVEVHFELRRFCIHRENEDSFNATIQQLRLYSQAGFFHMQVLGYHP